MEILTIVLSGLLAVLSPAGLIVDSVIENSFRSQFEEVEQLQVRIDNAPFYQIVGGKVDRVRIASRGVKLTPNVRIDTLELETDPINLDVNRLRQGGETAFRGSLNQPVQGGVRLVVTQEDIDRTLASKEIKDFVGGLINRFLSSRSPNARRYQLLNLRLQLLGNNRLLFQVQLQRSGSENEESEKLDIMLESGLKLVAGRSLQLIEPVASVNDKPISPRVVKGFASALSKRLDLRSLEEDGIIARILKLNIERDEMNLATFIRFEANRPPIAPENQ